MILLYSFTVLFCITGLIKLTIKNFSFFSPITIFYLLSLFYPTMLIYHYEFNQNFDYLTLTLNQKVLFKFLFINLLNIFFFYITTFNINTRKINQTDNYFNLSSSQFRLNLIIFYFLLFFCLILSFHFGWHSFTRYFDPSYSLMYTITSHIKMLVLALGLIVISQNILKINIIIFILILLLSFVDGSRTFLLYFLCGYFFISSFKNDKSSNNVIRNLFCFILAILILLLIRFSEVHISDKFLDGFFVEGLYGVYSTLQIISLMDIVDFTEVTSIYSISDTFLNLISRNVFIDHSLFYDFISRYEYLLDLPFSPLGGQVYIGSFYFYFGFFQFIFIIVFGLLIKKTYYVDKSKLVALSFLVMFASNFVKADFFISIKLFIFFYIYLKFWVLFLKSFKL